MVSRFHKETNIPFSDNLPAPVSTFIGREKEIAIVKRLILKNRLVSLTGSGGSGKTRLALEIASKLLDKNITNAWFIELASLRDPSLFLQNIASSLNIREQSTRSLLDSVVDFLSTRPTLLILDNCEHLINACAEIVNMLLQKCAGLSILVTSREILGITGEVVWVVPPLSLPESQPWRGPSSAQEALKEYQKSESVQLFTSRATTNDPDFELTYHNAGWVAEICRRLDGIPLSIELAAARVRTLSVKQIAERLDDRFKLLTSGSRTAPGRHQTLAATMDWSYALLSEKEQRLLQRFAVFLGGGTLEAIESVCGGEDINGDEVLDILSQLVDKSLVVGSQMSGKKRYSLLETIQEFALEKLVESREMKSAKNRHLDFFLQFAEKAEKKIIGSDQLIWYEQLETEHHNLRAALSWSLESQDADAGLRLAGSLSYFWFVRGHLREGVDWLEKVLNHKGSAPLASEAKALRFLGGLLISSENKDLERISMLFERSIKLYQEIEDRSGIAWILNQLGIIAMFQGEFTKAQQLFEESLALREEVGDPWDIAQTLQNFVPLFLRQNDYVRAREFAERTIDWFQRAGDKRGVARTKVDLAWIARMEGDFVRADSILIESISQLVQFGDNWSCAEVLETLALLASDRGDTKRAAIIFGATEALRDEVGMPLQAFEYESYEKDMAAIRRDLGEKAFNQAWTQGYAMTLEQVVDFLLNTPDEPKHTPAWFQKETFGGLTNREREAAIHIAEGKSNREIAEEMTVTVKTVEAYVTRILRKLGFNSRVQIATWVIDKDLR